LLQNSLAVGAGRKCMREFLPGSKNTDAEISGNKATQD
jgi:hypothetical protein